MNDAAAGALDGRMILIVDDSPDNRFVLGRWLRRHGCHVIEAETGVDGLSLAAAQPDAIVLDVRLADLSGLEVASRLKSDPHTVGIPILQRSSVAIAEAERIEGLDAGADAYLTEPISEAMLLSVLRSLLRFSDAQRQLEQALSLDVTGVFEASVRTRSVSWSDSLERLHRLEVGSFGGTLSDWLDLVHLDDRSRILDEATAIVERGAGSIQLDARIHRADGSDGWVELHGAVLADPSGEPVTVRGVVVDVTDRELGRRRADRLNDLTGRLANVTSATEVVEMADGAVRAFGVGIAVAPGGDPVAAADLAREPIPGGVLVARRHPSTEPTARVQRDDDLDHVATIVALAAVAYARAFSYETEVATSAALRRAILPDEVPDIDGWEIDVHHEAVDDSERIGGDFYDALRIGDDLVVVLGDVVGHGLEATHQMSTVRGMLRTVTSSLGADPAGILAQCNEIFERVCGRGAPFATVLLAAIHLPTGRGRVASAGHVAPILRRVSGIERLAIRPGPPLGVVPQTTYPITDVAIDDGDWIAVFTDGVFERRAEIIDDTIDRVLAQLDPSASASEIVGLAEITSLHARPTDDDRAMVLVRRCGSSLPAHADRAEESGRGAVAAGGS